MVYGGCWPKKALGLLGLSRRNGSPAGSCHRRLAGRVLSQTARRPGPVRSNKTKKNKKMHYYGQTV